jgi:hypothetical protein
VTVLPGFDCNGAVVQAVAQDYVANTLSGARISVTSHVTCHTSHFTRHTSHVIRHISHVTRHTSYVTRHTRAQPVIAARCTLPWKTSSSAWCVERRCAASATDTPQVDKHMSLEVPLLLNGSLHFQLFHVWCMNCEV